MNPFRVFIRQAYEAIETEDGHLNHGCMALFRWRRGVFVGVKTSYLLRPTPQPNVSIVMPNPLNFFHTDWEAINACSINYFSYFGHRR